MNGLLWFLSVAWLCFLPGVSFARLAAVNEIMSDEHKRILAAVDTEQDPARPRLKEGPAYAREVARIKAADVKRDAERVEHAKAITCKNT